MPLELISPVFRSGERMPDRYTCEDDNVSPPLRWRGAPEGTQSFALIFDDPDAGPNPWSHWVLYNLPPQTDQLPEGVPGGEQIDGGGMQGRSSFGNNEYEGPCPPTGEEHRYYLRLYALDTELDVSPGATRAQIMDVIQAHILERTEAIVTYRRSLPG